MFLAFMRSFCEFSIWFVWYCLAQSKTNRKREIVRIISSFSVRRWLLFLRWTPSLKIGFALNVSIALRKMDESIINTIYCAVIAKRSPHKLQLQTHIQRVSYTKNHWKSFAHKAAKRLWQLDRILYAMAWVYLTVVWVLLIFLTFFLLFSGFAVVFAFYETWRIMVILRSSLFFRVSLEFQRPNVYIFAIKCRNLLT